MKRSISNNSCSQQQTAAATAEHHDDTSNNNSSRKIRTLSLSGGQNAKSLGTMKKKNSQLLDICILIIYSSIFICITNDL
jgi:hypothetical protein